MTLIIKPPITKKQLEKLLLSATTEKGFDANAFCGKVKLNKSPRVIQKDLRDEWKQ